MPVAVVLGGEDVLRLLQHAPAVAFDQSQFVV